jgi:hypothetical protein
MDGRRVSSRDSPLAPFSFSYGQLAQTEGGYYNPPSISLPNPSLLGWFFQGLPSSVKLSATAASLAPSARRKGVIWRPAETMRRPNLGVRPETAGPATEPGPKGSGYPPHPGCLASGSISLRISSEISSRLPRRRRCRPHPPRRPRRCWCPAGPHLARARADPG